MDYDTAAEMADAVAGDVGFVIESALDARGEALVALPGGKSPAPIFERLAAAPIDWRDVTIIPTDDRLVPVDSPLSNVAMIARHFVPKGARVLPITLDGDIADYRTAGKSPMRGSQDSNGRPISSGSVWARTGIPHRSFPGPISRMRSTAPKARRAVGVMPDPLPAEAPVARVTLSRAAIVSARALLLTCLRRGEARGRGARH